MSHRTTDETFCRKRRGMFKLARIPRRWSFVNTTAPTKGATEASAHGWAGRPVVAFGARAVSFLAPVAASWTVTHFTAAGYWRPAGKLGLVLSLAQLAVVGAATVVLVGRVSRRLLPLAALFSPTIAFPYQAPSRFKVALRSRAKLTESALLMAAVRPIEANAALARELTAEQVSPRLPRHAIASEILYAPRSAVRRTYSHRCQR